MNHIFCLQIKLLSREEVKKTSRRNSLWGDQLYNDLVWRRECACVCGLSGHRSSLKSTDLYRVIPKVM